MHHPTDRITHTTAFVTPVVEHWLEREIADNGRNKQDEKRTQLKIKISNLLICFCSFDLSCPMLKFFILMNIFLKACFDLVKNSSSRICFRPSANGSI